MPALTPGTVPVATDGTHIGDSNIASTSDPTGPTVISATSGSVASRLVVSGENADNRIGIVGTGQSFYLDLADGLLKVTGLPTADPLTTGALYTLAGVLMVSGA